MSRTMASKVVMAFLGLSVLASSLAACGTTTINTASCGPASIATGSPAHPMVYSVYVTRSPKASGVIALDAVDGRVVWRYEIWGFPQILRDGVLYVSGGDSSITMLCANTGRLHLQTERAGAQADGLGETLLADNMLISMVLVKDPNPLAWGSTSYLVARRAQNGEEVWRRKRECNAMSANGSVIYVTGCNCDGITALNARDGSVRWSVSNTNPPDYCRSSGSALALENGVGFQNGGNADMARAIRLSDGTQIWRTPFQYASYAFELQEPVIGNGIVYTYGPRSVSALRASDGALLWTRPTPAQWYGVPLVAGNVIIGNADDNMTYALDAKTGQEIWSAQTRASPRSRMASWKDTVFVGGMDHVTALAMRDGAVKWSADVGDIVQSPMLVG